MLSAQDATRSQQCSVMPRRSCCVWVARQFYVSPLEAKRVSQRCQINLSLQKGWARLLAPLFRKLRTNAKGAHSGGNSISCILSAPLVERGLDRLISVTPATASQNSRPRRAHSA